METLGQRIKRLREAKNLTQPQLGKIVGVTKGAISQWEGGQVENIKLKTLLKLLVALGTDLPYLVYGPERTPPKPAAALQRPSQRQKASSHRESGHETESEPA